MSEVSKEQAQEYVEKYNASLPQAPMSFIFYRELLGVFYFLAFNRRMREILKRIVEITDKEEISTYNELISLLESKTLEQCFDADEIDNFFNLSIIDDDTNND